MFGFVNSNIDIQYTLNILKIVINLCDDNIDYESCCIKPQIKVENKTNDNNNIQLTTDINHNIPS